MSEKYIMAVDQSTQGTKALLFDGSGKLVCRRDRAHRQIINQKGWVEHDPEEIYQNTLQVLQEVIEQSRIDPAAVACMGISNQRETAVAWNRTTGRPVYHAIVWQCARGEQICRELEEKGFGEEIRSRTGLKLSPYFSAAKFAWILQNVEAARELAKQGELCLGTMDSWLVYRLTGGNSFLTDYSNASRTQLFNLHTLAWDETLCNLFGIPPHCLPLVRDSDGDFGSIRVARLFEQDVPIRGVLGDSHGALFGQGCLEAGMLKATYGTGSSIMMNTGEKAVFSSGGLVTSLAWKADHKVQYVLEGNINYTGAVVTWMKEQLGLIQAAGESEMLAKSANPGDNTYLVPAFSGLGAPYWRSDVHAAWIGMGRNTGKNELVKAGLCCIGYQIADLVFLMQKESGIAQTQLRADGGPTKNNWLMQFQSDILASSLLVSEAEELSGIGAGYMAGIGAGIYSRQIFKQIKRRTFTPAMNEQERSQKYEGWINAVNMVLGQ